MNQNVNLDRLVALYGQYGPEVQEWRVQPRRPAAAPVPIVLERDTGEAVNGTIRDLSRGGVGFILTVRMNVGERFTLRAVLRGRAVRLLGRVANCRCEGPGSFFIGAELLQAELPHAPTPSLAVAASPRPATPPLGVPVEGTNALPRRPVPILDEADDLLRKVAALLDVA